MMDEPDIRVPPLAAAEFSEEQAALVGDLETDEKLKAMRQYT